MATITIEVDTNHPRDLDHVATVISLVLGLSPFTYSVKTDMGA